MEGPIHLSLHKTFISFRMLWKRSRKQSLADVQLRNDGTIALDVLLGQVVEQAATLTDHLVHAKTAVVIVGMTLQVLGELADALGKNGDLDFGGTGVVLVGGVLADNFGLLVFGDHGDMFLSDSFCPATRQRAERIPQRRHDPAAEYADDASYIIIWHPACQEKCFFLLHKKPEVHRPAAPDSGRPDDNSIISFK